MAERKRAACRVGIDFSKLLGKSDKSDCSTRLAHARAALLEDRRDYNSAEDILFSLEGTPCPNCQEPTRVWPIFWGDPGSREIPEGYAMGGPCVSDDDPCWECQACKHRYGRRIDAPWLEGGQS